MSLRLMAAVWESAPCSQTTLLVLLALADHANDEGKCWPSVATLAKRTRTSERHVHRILLELKAAGWIAADERPGTTTVFTVTPPRDDTKVTPDIQVTPDLDVPPGVTPRSGRTDTQVRGGVTSRSPRTASESSKNHQRSTTDPLADYDLTEPERADFMNFIGARGNGLVVSLARSGDLPIRVADWRAARDTPPANPWDALPSVAELRARDDAYLKDHPPAPPGYGRDVMRQARQAWRRRPSEADLLNPRGPVKHCPYCGHQDQGSHYPWNCPAKTESLTAGDDWDSKPPHTHCVTCGQPQPCDEHPETP
jgi:hypothetical protein